MPAPKPPSPAPFNNPFIAALRKYAAEPAAAEPEQRSAQRAVLRYERKGRGGKEVTVIEKLDLSEERLSEWLRELKTSLGCGGVLAHGTIVLQGDQRTRARAWLVSRGVREVAG
jgi:translation initiation factor 1